MSDELGEVLDTAIYKEIAAEALYLAGRSRTEDPGARALMEELAGEERRHSQRLKKLKDTGAGQVRVHRENVRDLKLSQHLTAPDTIEGAGIQDTLAFAIRREQDSVDFYSRMMSAVADRQAKALCQRLAQQELKHKLKLETLYDDLFYAGD